MLPVQIKGTLFWFAVFWISLIGYTVIEGDSIITCIAGLVINTNHKVTHEGSTRTKWGNPGHATTAMAVTFYHSKSTLELLISRYTRLSSGTKMAQAHSSKNLFKKDGGKIAEKAKVFGNAKNTKKLFGLIQTDIRRLNSVCLNQISLLKLKRYYSQDSRLLEYLELDRKKPLFSELQNSDLNIISDEVYEKQVELVRLAELEGTQTNKVQDLQLRLARSWLFRIHALDLLRKKSGSETPGIDKMSLGRNDYDLLDNLNDFLRDMMKHPRNYKTQGIKRVWIPKPNKPEKRPLGIPTIRDRALQALVNLVLLPLVELTSESNSYGFRPYRDCKMAIGAVRSNLLSHDPEKLREGIITRSKNARPETGINTVTGKDKYILDADIKGFFDNINHN